MNTETIKTAASIVSPHGDVYFRGTLAEATDAMVMYAAEMRADYGGGATSYLASRLANSDPDRVAEIAAVALLKLAEAGTNAPDPFLLAINDDVLLDDMPACVVAVPAGGEYVFQREGGSLYPLTPAEVATRVRKEA